MRTFLSITPAPEVATAIEKWSAMCWPMIERHVPMQNYHLTLAFLGEINSAKLQAITESLDERALGASFELCLNTVGYWPDSRVLWLGSSETCEPIDKLAQTCKHIANRAGVRVSGKSFKPHITLARKLVVPPPAPLLEPDFTLRCDALQLYQSILDRDGARYIELESWGLH